MLYFQKTSDVVRFMLHQTDKASIYTFRAVAKVAFVLKLALLMAVKLFFLHWQCKTVNKSSQISFYGM